MVTARNKIIFESAAKHSSNELQKEHDLEKQRQEILNDTKLFDSRALLTKLKTNNVVNKLADSLQRVKRTIRMTE